MGLNQDLPGLDTAQKYAARYAPWRSGVPWMITLIQGLVLALIGVYVLAAQERAANVIVMLLAGYVAFTGVLAVISIFRGAERSGRAGQMALIRAGASLAIGVIVLILVLLPGVDTRSSATLLSIGLFVIGILSIIAVIFFRGGAPFNFGALLTGVIFVIFGAVVLMLVNGSLDFALFGWLALVGGAALIVLSLVRYNQLKNAAPAAA